MVFRLDRVARSFPHLIEIMDYLKSHCIAFQSVTAAIDTNTPNGRLLHREMGRFKRADNLKLLGRGISHSPSSPLPVTLF